MSEKPPRRIRSVEEYSSLLEGLLRARRGAFDAITAGGDAPQGTVEFLLAAKESFESLPRRDGKFVLSSSSGSILLSLRYVLSELEKDIIFLRDGEEALVEHLCGLHEGFLAQAQGLAGKLKDQAFELYVTDRDGTINNYCEQHRSSQQSVYNAVFIERFINAIPKAVVLTSAPLEDTLGISLLRPGGRLVVAGSKGREFDAGSGAVRESFSEEQESVLGEVRGRIESLLSQDRYRAFGLIGSGFQVKCGQLTIARQDIARSIGDDLSREWLGVVRKVVDDVDPEGGSLSTEDTGLDVEIILKASESEEYDKGTGASGLRKRLGLPGDDVLVSGDTASDIPLAGAFPGAAAVFVTKDAELKERVREKAPETFFVDSPDILVYALSLAARGGARK